MNPFFVIQSALTPELYLGTPLPFTTTFTTRDIDVPNGLLNYGPFKAAYRWTNEDEARGVYKFLIQRWPALKLVLVTENPKYTYEVVKV